MPSIECLQAENTQLKSILFRVGNEREIFKNHYEKVKTDYNNLEKRLEQYQQAYENLRHQLNELRRHRFGRKSERYLDPTHPQIDFLAKDKPPAKADDTETDTVSVSSHQRRKKKKKDTSHYPREIRIIPVAEEDKHCACGCQKAVVRYEIKELYHYQAAVTKIIEQRREVVACPNHCARSMQTAPAPLHVLPKVKATEEFLAHVVVGKCHHRHPLYHLEKYADQAGISRKTMARWMIQLADPLRPLINLMKDEVIGYDLSSVDATMLQVLKEPGRAPQKKSYVYCMQGGPPERAVVLYEYNAHDHKAFVDQWYEGFKGSIHMDADPFFDLLISDPEVFAAYCNSHARRKFEAITQQVKQPGLAHEAMGFYKRLYRVEREAKQQQLSASQRHALRLQKSQPILEAFKSWLDEHRPLILPKSYLGKSFDYCLNHWQGLTHFLRDGRIEIDNNRTEQKIKPFVMARKGFLFADTIAGAHALCLHFSLIQTALPHGLDPYEYYVMILKKIPMCRVVEDYELLLPWNIDLPKRKPPCF